MSANILSGLFRKGMVSTLLLFAVVLSFQLVAEYGEMEDMADAPLLVDVGWLVKHLDDPEIVVIDARLPADYEKGHIAGAVNLPFIDTFKTEHGNGVVSQRKIEEIMGGLGISNDSHVVVYGDFTYMDAARVFWTLNLYSQAKLSLLNGAYPAWERSGLPVDTQTPVMSAVNYRAVVLPGKMATRLQTLLAIKNPRIVIVDVREVADFQGIQSSARRFGHIPSAISIPVGRNLEVRQGVFYYKSESALEKIYAGLDGYEKIILYCNTGSEAAISYLALSLLNKNVAVYDGAWREWGNSHDLPIESSVP